MSLSHRGGPPPQGWDSRGPWPHLCNGQLLLGHVARHVDHLHAVPEWLRDGLGDVGRADEQHLGEAAVRSWRNGRPVVPRQAGPRAERTPWTSPRARPGSGPGSWRSARGPAAQAVLTRGPPGNPGQFCPPGRAKGGWCWHPVLLLVPAHHSGEGVRRARTPPAPGAGAGGALSRSRRAGLAAWLWADTRSSGTAGGLCHEMAGLQRGHPG